VIYEIGLSNECLQFFRLSQKSIFFEFVLQHSKSDNVFYLIDDSTLTWCGLPQQSPINFPQEMTSIT
jgi:hypothetical protein